MARAIWSGSVSFGLLNVPVKLYSAVARKQVSFRELRASDASRVRHKRATILMAGPHRPVKSAKRLPEALIAKMCYVQNQSEPINLTQQFAAFCAKAATGAGAIGVSSRPVMGRPYGAQPLFTRSPQMAH